MDTRLVHCLKRKNRLRSPISESGNAWANVKPSPSRRTPGNDKTSRLSTNVFRAKPSIYRRGLASWYQGA